MLEEATRLVPALPSERALAEALEPRLASYFGEWRPIVRMARRPSPYTSTFAIEEIDVELSDGAVLPLVMKDLSVGAMAESARRARPAFLNEPRRELAIYRDVLPHAPAGTAAYYGAAMDPATGDYRLFLERVEGFELRHVGELAAWEDAARWIGRFHRSPAVARSTPDVLVYDEAFYWLWLERAQRFAHARPAVRDLLAQLARRYGAVVRRLASLPRVLIHGELYPCNVLVSQRRSDDAGNEAGLRICPIDWEMAASGPGLMDLATLTTGWDLAAQRALMAAYGETAGERWTDFHCCRLHLAVKMLGWSDTWEPPPQHAHDWLAEVRSLMGEIPD